MAAMPAVTAELPAPFIGRAANLAALSELVDTSAVVTVLGPPGVGKTRFVSRFAALHAERFQGGAIFCDLTETADGLGVCSAVARSLDVPLASSSREEELVATLGRVLRARSPVLVVLDTDNTPLASGCQASAEPCGESAVPMA